MHLRILTNFLLLFPTTPQNMNPPAAARKNVMVPWEVAAPTSDNDDIVQVSL
jgi:hypothetical protein